MKIKYFYLLFFLFAGTIIFYLSQKKKTKTELTLIERKGYIANSAEWLNTKAAIEKLLADLRSNPNNKQAKINLALAYIQESRITGNHSYYDAAALQLIDELLDDNANNFEALCAKATIQLSQHHFADALETGNRTVKINSHSAYGFGILTDANVELGNYDEAIKNADQMVSLRPDIRSYSRVSYLREIFGDIDGAIDAMNMAVQAGLPGAEQTEWARIYVGHLYEISGKIDSAEQQYQLASIHRPDYPFAYAGLGRIAKEKRNYTDAIKYYNAAKNSMKDFSFNDGLADVYNAMSKPTAAYEELQQAIAQLQNGSKGGESSVHGHYSDRELALLYLKTYRYDLALNHALTEYNRRPANIDVNQALAWVRYHRGEYADANKKIDAALRTGSKNPTLLLQAGLIKIKSGNTAEGNKLINRSLTINRYVDPEMKFEMEKVMGRTNLLFASAK